MTLLRQTYPVQRALMALNNALPDKAVRRRVQGVDLLLPRSHPLPLFTQGDSPYGVNLAELARGLGGAAGLTMLDIGGNVGDSAARALHAVSGRGHVVCVEPDPAWLPYLRENTANAGDVTIEEAFLVTDASHTEPVAPVHHSPGTTRFETAVGDTGVLSLTPEDLLRRNPRLQDVRLIKTDTDGFDISLVPVLARTFAGSRPVIFFEYDPRLTKVTCPDVDPASVWDSLAELGYEQLAVWDHGGRPLGRCSSKDVRRHLHLLEPASVLDRRRAKGYWDVAAVHVDDQDGRSLTERLVPTRL